jgi:hypothetical protein
VAIAPDAVLVLLILDDAIQVGARGAKGSVIVLPDPDEKNRIVSEPDDLEALLHEFRIVCRAGLDLIRR